MSQLLQNGLLSSLLSTLTMETAPLTWRLQEEILERNMQKLMILQQLIQAI